MSFIYTDTPKINLSFARAICRTKGCTNFHVKGKSFCSACLQKPISRIIKEDKEYERLFHHETWVYFVSIEGLEPIKIGRARDVDSRLKSLQVATPNKIELLAKFKGPYYAEQFLHDMYKEFNVRGEWFTPVAEILELIDLINSGNTPKYLTGSKELMSALV